jgi:hypothetical protein
MTAGAVDISQQHTHRTAEDVTNQILAELGGSLGSLLTALGNRAGLWADLDGRGPVAPADLASRTGVQPAIVREWCRAQAAAGYLGYDPATGTFTLPAEVADAVLRGPAGALVDACVDMLGSLGQHFEEISEAFVGGRGFGWHRLGERYWRGTDALTRVAVPAPLIGAVLAALGPMTRALQSGGSVLDVGCGYGYPTVEMARLLPAAQVLGGDYHEGSVRHARDHAERAGLADRVRFDVAAATDLPGTGYQLITFFDSLHDLGDPVAALACARDALAPDGAVLLVEPSAADHVEGNLHPGGRMFYSVSTLVCTPNAVSQGAGTGSADPLGTQAGAARLAEVATTAGFASVRRLPVDAPLNLVLELRAAPAR